MSPPLYFYRVAVLHIKIYWIFKFCLAALLINLIYIFNNNEKLCPCRFSWQEGYGGFTYSRSQIADVYYYIENQEFHHKKRTFNEEYVDILTKNEIEFDQQFLFDFWDNCL